MLFHPEYPSDPLDCQLPTPPGTDLFDPHFNALTDRYSP